VRPGSKIRIYPRRESLRRVSAAPSSQLRTATHLILTALPDATTYLRTPPPGALCCTRAELLELAFERSRARAARRTAIRMILTAGRLARSTCRSRRIHATGPTTAQPAAPHELARRSEIDGHAALAFERTEARSVDGTKVRLSSLETASVISGKASCPRSSNHAIVRTSARESISARRSTNRRAALTRPCR